MLSPNQDRQEGRDKDRQEGGTDHAEVKATAQENTCRKEMLHEVRRVYETEKRGRARERERK